MDIAFLCRNIGKVHSFFPIQVNHCGDISSEMFCAEIAVLCRIRQNSFYFSVLINYCGDIVFAFSGA